MSAHPVSDPTAKEVIDAFPRIAEWCVERMAGDSDIANRRKDEVWAVLREVLALRRATPTEQNDE